MCQEDRTCQLLVVFQCLGCVSVTMGRLPWLSTPTTQPARPLAKLSTQNSCTQTRNLACRASRAHRAGAHTCTALSTMDAANLKKYTVLELTNELTSRGLETKGKKASRRHPVRVWPAGADLRLWSEQQGWAPALPGCRQCRLGCADPARLLQAELVARLAPVLEEEAAAQAAAEQARLEAERLAREQAAEEQARADAEAQAQAEAQALADGQAELDGAALDAQPEEQEDDFKEEQQEPQPGAQAAAGGVDGVKQEAAEVRRDARLPCEALHPGACQHVWRQSLSHGRPHLLQPCLCYATCAAAQPEPCCRARTADQQGARRGRTSTRSWTCLPTGGPAR